METNLLRKAANLEEKIPDIDKTLQMVRHLETRKDDDETMKVNFELNDTLYARASVPPTESVYLWLGVISKDQYNCA